VKKARDRAREKIREKISPPLEPAAISELMVRVLQWWACTWWSGSSGGGCTPGGQFLPVMGMHSKGLVPSPFIPFGCLSHSFPTVLKNESVVTGWGGGDLGGLTFLPQRQVLCFLACMT